MTGACHEHAHAQSRPPLRRRTDLERPQLFGCQRYQQPAAAAGAPRGGRSTGRSIRGGVGLYTQQHLLYYINSVQLEGPDGTVTVSLAPDSPLFPAVPECPPAFPPGEPYPPRDIHGPRPDFRNPYSVQATVGVRADDSKRHRCGGLRLSERPRSDEPGRRQRAGSIRNRRSAPSRRLTPRGRSRPLPGGFRNIVTLGNQGRSWYHALQLKADRSTGRLQAMASYTLSHAEDMLNYQLPEDSRNLDAEKRAGQRRCPAQSRPSASPGECREPGRVLAGLDRSRGSGFSAATGRTRSTWGDDRNGTTQNDARPDGRNTGDTDAYQNLDLALDETLSAWIARSSKLAAKHSTCSTSPISTNTSAPSVAVLRAARVSLPEAAIQLAAT